MYFEFFETNFTYSSSPDESYVRLTDEDGLDIGQLMCEHNFASKGNYVPYSDEVYMPA